MKVSTHLTEDGRGRAEVHTTEGVGHEIRYFDNNGKRYHSETFGDKQLHELQIIADEWSDSIHTLHG
ncbi:MAG: hypothetical protein COA84_13055 [Robiginitomaculum sp.]|nr:MAG: hypothetical protein COA84_13055 [Robiginitomaculum sp.]